MQYLKYSITFLYAASPACIPQFSHFILCKALKAGPSFMLVLIHDGVL